MRQQSDPVVLVEDAYEAARVRALKTTEALVLAEARIIGLTRRVDELQALTKEQRAELQRYFDREEDRAREAVKGDGGTDPVGYTEAVGQAD